MSPTIALRYEKRATERSLANWGRPLDVIATPGLQTLRYRVLLNAKIILQFEMLWPNR